MTRTPVKRRTGLLPHTPGAGSVHGIVELMYAPLTPYARPSPVHCVSDPPSGVLSSRYHDVRLTPVSVSRRPTIANEPCDPVTNSQSVAPAVITSSTPSMRTPPRLRLLA